MHFICVVRKTEEVTFVSMCPLNVKRHDSDAPFWIIHNLAIQNLAILSFGVERNNEPLTFPMDKTSSVYSLKN
jgi:hypothetical protein